MLKPINCRLDWQALDAFAAWCPTRQFQLNISKCLWTRFSLAYTPIINYSLSGIELTQVTTINNLGVTFHSNLNISSHWHKVAAKECFRVSMLLKCFHTKDRSLQCKLFSVFVLPILLYNSPIWSPHFVKDIVVIERVQKYFTKNLKGLRDKPSKKGCPFSSSPLLNIAVPTMSSSFYTKLSTDFLTSFFKIFFLLLPLTLTLFFDVTLIN